MKTTMIHPKKMKGNLDIRFVPMDSMNPNFLIETLSEENAEKIRKELYSKLGHLSHEIARSNGHINVYTLGNSIVGHPQFVNFTKAVWDNINFPYDQIPERNIEEELKKAEDDYLDHENYDDV